MKKYKRWLSIFLTALMVITGVDYNSLNISAAENEETQVNELMESSQSTELVKEDFAHCFYFQYKSKPLSNVIVEYALVEKGMPPSREEIKLVEETKQNSGCYAFHYSPRELAEGKELWIKWTTPNGELLGPVNNELTNTLSYTVDYANWLENYNFGQKHTAYDGNTYDFCTMYTQNFVCFNPNKEEGKLEWNRYFRPDEVDHWNILTMRIDNNYFDFSDLHPQDEFCAELKEAVDGKGTYQGRPFYLESVKKENSTYVTYNEQSHGYTLDYGKLISSELDNKAGNYLYVAFAMDENNKVFDRGNCILMYENGNGEDDEIREPRLEIGSSLEYQSDGGYFTFWGQEGFRTDCGLTCAQSYYSFRFFDGENYQTVDVSKLKASKENPGEAKFTLQKEKLRIQEEQEKKEYEVYTIELSEFGEYQFSYDDEENQIHSSVTIKFMPPSIAVYSQDKQSAKYLLSNVKECYLRQPDTYVVYAYLRKDEGTRNEFLTNPFTVKTYDAQSNSYQVVTDASRYYSAEAIKEQDKIVGYKITLKPVESFRLQISGKYINGEGDGENTFEYFSELYVSERPAPGSSHIFFDSNNESSVSMNPIMGIMPGETITLPANQFVREGYIFTGWNTDKNGSGEKYEDKANFVNLSETECVYKLYAQWEPIEYSITYELNGGVNDTKNPEKYVVSEEITLLAASKIGYTFGGWYTDKGFKEETKVEKIAVGSTGSIVIYAKWNADKYTVTFDADGGTILSEDGQKVTSKEVIFDTAYGKLPTAEKEGYTFDGWYTDRLDGEKVDERTILSTAQNHSLYARYLLKYSVGTITASVSTEEKVPVGTLVSLSVNTLGAKIYYTLDGSRPTKDNGKLYEDALELQADTTIRAIAVMEGYNDSAVLTLQYSVIKTAEEWGDVSETDRKLMNFADADAIPEGVWVAGIETAVYNGTAITYPEARVYYHKILLQEKTDYTVKYSRNINAGTASMDVTLKGNYSGKESFSFEIEAADIKDAVAPDIYLANKYREQKGITTVTYTVNGKTYTLKNNVDYTYEYPAVEMSAVGKYVIKIKGKGNYTGETGFTQVITDSTLMNTLTFGKIPAQRYTSGGVELDSEVFKVYDKKQKKYLEYGKDFMVGTDSDAEAYVDNDKVGTAKVTLIGLNDYVGTKTLTFNILGIPMNRVKIEGLEKTFEYEGSAIEQFGYDLFYTDQDGFETTLLEGMDYEVTYQNNTNAGRGATILFTGKGEYYGTVKKNFSITAVTMDDEDGRFDVTMEEEYAYIKGGVKVTPVVSYNGENLIPGKDYILSYKNNTVVNGTKTPMVIIKGKGNFKGSLTREFSIMESDISVTGMTATDVVFKSKPTTIKSTIIVYDANGSKLTAGSDYDKKIAYTYSEDCVVQQIDTETKNLIDVEKLEGEEIDMTKDILPVGTLITATVTGMKNYTGTQSVVFRIIKGDVAKAKVKIKDKEFTGKEIILTKDDFTSIAIGKESLTKADFEILADSYVKNVEKGTASVQIRGIGEYGGVKTVTFKITAKKALKK